MLRQLLLLLLVLTLSNGARAQTTSPSKQPDFPFDSTTSLAARVHPPTATVLQLFRDAGMAPTEHSLTAAEQSKVAAAFAALPPLHQRILGSHLRSISFLDNMPNTALTSTVNPGEAHQLFDISFRAEILSQDVSEWLTWKEATCFDTTQSSLRVAIQAGHLNAFLYVLLHEATHVVDGALGITPNSALPAGAFLIDSLATNFVKGSWAGHSTVAAAYKSSLLDGIAFRRGGQLLSVTKAKEAYRALEKTPFVSLYGRNSWNEDLAEYLTVYHFTQKLKQPFTITIRDGNQNVYAYQPMKSRLVSRRFKYMSQFYRTS
ncbi:hypothetical protein P1X16_22740 [Hymenobacter sp. YC55]|nr:hypothetical protein [Hymenobacter sp. YC55]